MFSDNNEMVHREADNEQAERWRDVLDTEIDEISAAIENVEKRALAEHRVGAVGRAAKFDAESAKLRATLQELHRMRRNLQDRFS